MPKTFDYQLGEVRGREQARAFYLDGKAGTVTPERAATVSAEARGYLIKDDRSTDYIAGFVAAWTTWFEAPEFLHGAEPTTPVIVTEGTLRAALAALFPAATELDFEGRVARALITHITQEAS